MVESFKNFAMASVEDQATKAAEIEKRPKTSLPRTRLDKKLKNFLVKSGKPEDNLKEALYHVDVEHGPHQATTHKVTATSKRAAEKAALAKHKKENPQHKSIYASNTRVITEGAKEIQDDNLEDEDDETPCNFPVSEDLVAETPQGQEAYRTGRDHAKAKKPNANPYKTGQEKELYDLGHRLASYNLKEENLFETQSYEDTIKHLATKKYNRYMSGSDDTSEEGHHAELAAQIHGKKLNQVKKDRDAHIDKHLIKKPVNEAKIGNARVMRKNLDIIQKVLDAKKNATGQPVKQDDKKQ